MSSLNQTIQANRQSNILRFKSRPEHPTIFQILNFLTLCNEDEEAIRRCFEAVPGDPLDK